MAADWWARGISLGSAGVTLFNVAIAYRAFKRVGPKVRIFAHAEGVVGPTVRTVKRPARFSVRLLNDGTTTVSVERIELYSLHAIDGEGGKILEVREFERGKPGAELLDIPALGGTAYNFTVEQSVVRGVYSTRIRVLLSNGQMVSTHVSRSSRIRIK